MTTPGVGAPDFQGYSQWRGTPIGQTGTQLVTSGVPFTAAGYVTNFSSLLIFVGFTAGIGVTVTASFFTDNTLATQLGSYQWVLSTVPATLDVIVPCVGDYAQVTVSTGQTGTQQVIMDVEPCNVAVSKPAYQCTPNSTDGLAVSIGSGVSQVVQLPFVVEGQGQLFVQNATAGVSFNIEADAMNEARALASNLNRATAITGSGLLTFLAPAAPVQMLIKNNDAAAHNFSWHCQVLSQ